MTDGHFPSGPRLPVTGGAARRIAEYAEQDSRLLLREAETVALQRRDVEIVASHVDEARGRLTHQPRQSRSRARLVYLGAAALGVGAQGFFTEIFAKSPKLELIAIWVVLSFAGFAVTQFVDV